MHWHRLHDEEKQVFAERHETAPRQLIHIRAPSSKS
jgi:hypothetical protein